MHPGRLEKEDEFVISNLLLRGGGENIHGCKVFKETFQRELTKFGCC